MHVFTQPGPGTDPHLAAGSALLRGQADLPIRLADDASELQREHLIKPRFDLGQAKHIRQLHDQHGPQRLERSKNLNASHFGSRMAIADRKTVAAAERRP